MENKRVPATLDPKVALSLLTRAEFGRVAFILDGEPTIRPLNHAVVDGAIYVYTLHTSAFAEAVRAQPGLHVAYQSDEIERRTRLGWSVLVTGTATDASDHPRAAQLSKQVQSWMDRPHDTIIAIKPQVVTGLRLTIEHRRPHVQ